MERAVAIKKLGKILGKSLGYQVDPKAPDQDERDKAREKLRETAPKRDALGREKNARRDKIVNEALKADAEYQRLKSEYAEAEKICSDLSAITSHYRFTVGVSNSMFFSVRAQGDSWEEVISKLTEKQIA